MTPETRYAEHNGIHIAYQVVGSGPLDVVYLPGLWSHAEHVWREPSYAAFLQRLSSFSRLIMVDTRGSGLSDRVAIPLLEHQIDDILAVLDAVGSSRATVVGVSQSGPLAVVLTASHPDRVSSLVLYGAYATALSAPGHPWGRTSEWVTGYLERVHREWGTGTDVDLVAPSKHGDHRFASWWAALERYSNAPGNAIAYIEAHSQDDVRAVLPAISVPTLVLHRSGDVYRPIDLGRYIASQIPDARLVEMEGADHLPYLGDAESIIGEIEEFVTGMRGAVRADRVLATVLFTDIVDSTATAASVGDAEWRNVLSEHNRVTRELLGRFRGHEVKMSGDGVLATFDGPARAIGCALALRDALSSIGIGIRAGVHTGEVEVMGDDVGGIAVHIGARVSTKAGRGEVMVSRTVKDLVAGSGMVFTERGVHHLKGVPDEWQLYSVE